MNDTNTLRRGWASPLVMGACLWGVISLCGLQPVAAQPNECDTAVVLDAGDRGMLYEGAGAISASSTRLLYDYPEPERSQILDYLFKPGCGGEMQLLKVEIGSDMNSTDLAEPSHMRVPGVCVDDLGFEWWLMEEAKKRNPEIKLYALAWGAPGWVGKFWSQPTIDYILSWLDLAHDKGFVIDYVGGWNERGWDADWYIDFGRALKERFPHIRLVAADDVRNPWAIALEMVENRALREAIDIVGVHSPCGWRSTYSDCRSPEEARSLKKPLWNSEHSSMTHDFGAMPLARAMNRLYTQAGIVGNMCWSLVSAWYSSLPIPDTGLILAEWPWSGYYEVGKSIWVYAHTTQFAKIGWQYMDGACGAFRNGATFVSRKSPDRLWFSTVVETCDAQEDVTVDFSLSEPFRDDRVYVWSTDLVSDRDEDHFVLEQTLEPKGRSYRVTFRPGRVYTVTNTTGQGKSTARPRAQVDDLMPLPYEEDFEGYGRAKLARYFCDLNGGFETAPAGGGRTGYAYRQMVTQMPISWTTPVLKPSTVIGDPRWWGDYEVSVDVLLEEPGYAEVLGRIAVRQDTTISGYHLRIDHLGNWKLYVQDLARFGPWEQILGSGRVNMGLEQWHRLGLRMQGDRLTVLFDDKRVGQVRDDYHISGQAGLATSQWHHVQFDNLKIDKTAQWPLFVPVRDLHVEATSEHTRFHKGYSFLAVNAIDARPETTWYTEWGPKVGLPQSLTIDLGRERPVKGLVYQPRREMLSIHRHTHGYVTRCAVFLGDEQGVFEKVASAQWEPGVASKQIEWRMRKARYVRFEALEGTNGEASVGELSIITE